MSIAAALGGMAGSIMGPAGAAVGGAMGDMVSKSMDVPGGPGQTLDSNTTTPGAPGASPFIDIAKDQATSWAKMATQGIINRKQVDGKGARY